MLKVRVKSILNVCSEFGDRLLQSVSVCCAAERFVIVALLFY